jgi:hypothetical protein
VSIVSSLGREQAQCQALEKKVVRGGMRRSDNRFPTKALVVTKVYFVGLEPKHASSDNLESLSYENFCKF